MIHDMFICDMRILHRHRMPMQHRMVLIQLIQFAMQAQNKDDVLAMIAESGMHVYMEGWDQNENRI